MNLNGFSKWLQYNGVKNLRGSEYFPYPLYVYVCICMYIYIIRVCVCVCVCVCVYICIYTTPNQKKLGQYGKRK